MRPGTISDQDFLLFRPICEKLVAKGHLKPGALEVFGLE
jgi:hypothetical protein